MPPADQDAIALERLHRQRLLGAPCESPEEAVAWLLAVQSQDHGGAKWAVAQRVAGGDDASVEKAYAEGRILRTHVLRPTWHYVTPADIRWLLALTGPRVHAANAYMCRKLELDGTILRKSHASIEKALSKGTHLTRVELARALAAAGIRASGLRLGYLVMCAELDAVIASGAPRGKQHTYALLDQRAPDARRLGRDEALAELALRFVRGHGPAQAPDLAGWSGLTVTDARRALEAAGSALERFELEGATYHRAPGKAPRRHRGPRIHLLPNYDELVSGFKDRTALLDPALVGRAGLERFFFAHLVARDGRLVGGWRRTLGKREVRVEVDLLVPLAPAGRDALEAEAARYGASLGVPARLVVRDVSGRPRAARQVLP